MTTWFWGLSTLVSGAALAWVSQLEPLAALPLTAAHDSFVATQEQVVLGDAPAPPAIEPSAAPAAVDDPRQQPSAAAQPRGPGAAELAAARRLELETAEQDRRRHESIEKDIKERDIAAARRSVSITMYSAKWCGVCTKARKYMDDKNIVYLERDVDESPSANERARQLNPDHSVRLPTIDVDGEVMVGFGDEHLEQMIDAAARKRAGS